MGTDSVDAVVTWVDGSDPVHEDKRTLALRGLGDKMVSAIPAGIDRTRFKNNNEVEYCLRSIRKFAPWVRRIFLVTDQQCPEFLDVGEKVKLGVVIVDHKEIFEGYESVLPTFNSLSIETVLHRIPGLASRYIYLNDDFILLGPVEVDDFFTSDGVVLRGGWRKLSKFGRVRLLVSKALNRIFKELFGINRAMSVLQQMRGAQVAGAEKKFFKVEHVPYPFRKETLCDFFGRNEGELHRNIVYKFRDFNQYAATALANHLELAQGKARLKAANDAVMVCFNRDGESVVAEKIKQVEGGGVKFLCIQSYEQASEQQKERVLLLLKEKGLVE